MKFRFDFQNHHPPSLSSRFLPGSISVLSSSYAFGPMTAADARTGLVLTEVNSGEVMVEVEPERYEIEIHTDPRSKAKVRERNNVRLRE